VRVRPDDDIYRARLLFLGPRGYTLPVQLPYVAYPLFAGMLALVVLLRFMILGTIDPFPAVEIAISLVLTSLILRRVSPDRPVRAVLRTAATDWRPRRAAAERADRVTASVRVRKSLV
jgi:hypothetical protein